MSAIIKVEKEFTTRSYEVTFRVTQELLDLIKEGDEQAPLYLMSVLSEVMNELKEVAHDAHPAQRQLSKEHRLYDAGFFGGGFTPDQHWERQREAAKQAMYNFYMNSLAPKAGKKP